MSNIAIQTTMRGTGLMLMALTIGVTISWADVIQSTVELPPLSGSYTLGGICVSALNRCTEDATVSGFMITNEFELGVNEIVETNASYSADIFTDNGGVPGTFLGHLSLTGTADFAYEGRNPSVDPLGTFATDLTDFDFTGMLNGKTFEVKQDPENASAGSTTILETTFVPPIEYSVSSSLDIFADYSFNGSPFVMAPERIATLNAVPEPVLGSLATSILVGGLGFALRRRRIR